GNAAFASKDYQAAVRHYSMAILLDDSNKVLFSNRSASHAALGDFSEALSDAELAVNLAPDWPKAHSRKGAALVGMGDFARAVASY
ncbi:hypothetical protein T484DRAFT_1573043, partial [Baffinella frigidus]